MGNVAVCSKPTRDRPDEDMPSGPNGARTRHNSSGSQNGEGASNGTRHSRTPSTLPPMRLYKKSPIKAMKRFRLPPAGKRLYDLEREKEKVEKKQRNNEQDQKRFREKIGEYQGKLATAETEHESHNTRMAHILQQIDECTNEAASQLNDPEGLGSGSPRNSDLVGFEDELSCMTEDIDYDFVDFESDDEDYEGVWEEALAQDPEAFNILSPDNQPGAQPRGRKSGLGGDTRPATPNGVPKDSSSRISVDELANLLKRNPGTSVLHPTSWHPIPPQRNAHCWENKLDNDLFEGTSILFLRDKDPEKNGVFQEQIWQGKNRVYTLQVQGRFKRKPKGPLCFYLAALDDVASLGMVSKRLGKMWLTFARNWEKGIDINFKNEPGKPLAMLAPITPAWCGIIETRPGEKAPELGHRFPSYKECIEKTGYDLGYVEDPKLDCTYSFEFYTANLDCIYWKFVGIPVLPEIKLSRLAPAFAAIAGTSGYVGMMREMGSEDEKFSREGTGGDLCNALVIHQEGV